MDALMLYQLKQFLIDNVIELSSSNGTNAKVIQDNCNEIKMCPVCNNILSKNGHTKFEVQKYVCSSCGKTLSSTTNTLTYYSKLSFEIWKNQISDFFDGLSLRRTAEKNNISTTSAFNIRHKILNLIHDFIESIKLRERAQLDEKYIKINLKGTKPENMPRYSKKRKSSGSAGLNKHLVCIASGVDSNDNIILKIVGLGKVSTEMLREAFTNKLEMGTEVVTDGDTAYRKLCEENGTKLIAIPSKKHTDEYGNSLGDINSVHAQLENILSNFHGVSTRHIQKYLDWFSYLFMMIKKFTSTELELKMCEDFIMHKDFIKTTDISKRDFPNETPRSKLRGIFFCDAV